MDRTGLSDSEMSESLNESAEDFVRPDPAEVTRRELVAALRGLAWGPQPVSPAAIDRAASAIINAILSAA